MKLKPSGYVHAEASRKPGYLAKRMAIYRARIKEQIEAQRMADAEAALKVSKIKAAA